MPDQTRTLNGKLSILLCPRNPNFSAAQSSVFLLLIVEWLTDEIIDFPVHWPYTVAEEEDSADGGDKVMGPLRALCDV